MGMNVGQQRYAIKRIDDALKTRLALLKEKYVITAKEVSDKDKLQAIRDGDVNLKPGVKLTTTLGEAFNFSYLKNSEDFDDKGYFKAKVPIEAEANSLKDRVMLSECGLDEISKFCKGV